MNPVFETEQSAAEAMHRRADVRGYTGTDWAFFTTVAMHAREAELKGDDLEPLWRKYRDDPNADTAVAAFLEGVASARRTLKQIVRKAVPQRRTRDGRE